MLSQSNIVQMNKLSTYLRQPYPLSDRPWLAVGICLVCLVFILTMFEPFNYRFNSLSQFWVLVGFVIMTLIGSVISFVLLPRLFRQFYNPDNWTVGKNLINSIIFLFIMGLLIVLYDTILLPILFDFSYEHTVEEYIRVIRIDLLATFTIGLIPLVLFTIITQNSSLKRNLGEAILLNKTLMERIKPEANETLRITLAGTTKESVSVIPDNILYLESSGNYVDVYYMEEKGVQHKLLRSTIRQSEDELSPYPFLVRCHRAFMVNVNQITNVSGNAQGYKLSLQNTSKDIPVSRTYMKNLKDSLI